MHTLAADLHVQRVPEAPTPAQRARVASAACDKPAHALFVLLRPCGEA